MRSVLFSTVFALGLFAALQEVALRGIFPVREVVNFDRVFYSPKAFATRKVHEANLAHASFLWQSGPDDFAFRHDLNLYGFRDREWSAEPEPGRRRIAFVGDSFTEGFSSDGDNTLPAAFERAAAAAGLSLEAMNFGIGGAGPKHYAQLIRDVAPIFRPESVILVFYENDAVPVVFDPKWLRKPRAPVFSDPWTPRLVHVLRERSAGRRVPRRWHAEPFPYLASVPDPRNSWSHPEQAEKLETFVAADIGEHMRQGRFNPAMALYYRFAESNMPRPVDMTQYLRSLNRYLESHGTDLYLVYIPTKSQVTQRYEEYVRRYSRDEVSGDLTGSEYQIHGPAFAATCAKLGIPYFDLSEDLRALEASGPKLFWDYDDHFRPVGYRTAAKLIFDWWQRASTAAAAAS